MTPTLLNNFRTAKIKPSFPVIVQPKYNGWRATATADGIFKKEGKQYTNVPHIEAALKTLFWLNPHLVLDGELIIREGKNKDFSALQSALQTQKPALNVRFVVFDGYGFKNILSYTPAIERNNELRKFLYIADERIRFATSFFLASEKEIMGVFYGLVKDGYEGAVVRTHDATYQHGRTDEVLKLKPRTAGIMDSIGDFFKCA